MTKEELKIEFDRLIDEKGLKFSSNLNPFDMFVLGYELSKLHQPTVSICACGSNEYYVEQYKDVTKYYCKSCHEKISKH